MPKILVQDLFDSNIPTQTPSTVIETQVPVSNSVLTDSTLSAIAANFNLYTIAWSVFVSFLFIANFYFYFVLYSDGEGEREDQAKNSLKAALWIWVRYIPCWLILFFATRLSGIIGNIFLVVSILGFLVKLYFDLISLLGSSTYFDWFESFSSKFKGLLEFYKTSFKSKK